MTARQRFWLVTAAALLGLLAALALARWQWSRGQQRDAVQAAIDAQAMLPALGNQDLAAPGLGSNLVHRRAVLAGEWEPAKTIYLDNRSMAGRPGFYVLTPLRLEGVKPAIVVQRGWVARDPVNPAKLPTVGAPEGRVEVEGRLAGEPSRLLDLQDTRAGPQAGPIRQNLRLQDFSEESGLALLGVTLLQTRQGGVPDGLLRDWPVVSSGAAKNYAYAFQWLAIGGVVAGFYVWFQLIPFGKGHAAKRKP